MNSFSKLLVSVFLLFSISVVCFANSNIKPSSASTFNYEREWKEVQKMEDKDLPKSVLDKVENILNQAKSENNINQQIKSQVFIIKHYLMIGEKNLPQVIADLQELQSTSVFPKNAIVSSMIAELLWRYYQDNRWKFYNRTETIGFDNKDLETWSLQQILFEIKKYYTSSIAQTSDLMQIPVSDFSEILTPHNDTSLMLRPTLYHFMAYRALDFFENTESEITKVPDDFRIDDKSFFVEPQLYATKNIEIQDTSSNLYYSCLIYQKLLKWSLSNNDTVSLIEAELNRLKFINSASVVPSNTDVYANALARLIELYSSNSDASRVYLVLAELVYGNNFISELNNFEIKGQNNYVKAYNIYNTIIEKYPNTNAANISKNRINEIKTKRLSMEYESSISPNTPFAIKINYKNIEKTYITIAEIKQDKISQINKSNNDRNKRQYLKILDENSVKIHSLSIDMLNTDDFDNHSLELVLQSLKLGQYIIWVSDKENFLDTTACLTYAQISVSNLSSLHNVTNAGELLIFVLNRQTGKALEGVEVDVYSKKYDYRTSSHNRKELGKFKTDKNGSVFVDCDKENQIYYDLKQNNDIEVSSSPVYVYESNRGNRDFYKLHFFTDRAIYRPGQTVHFKAILLFNREDSVSLAENKDVQIRFLDLNYQQKDLLNLKTNSFGSLSGNFKIPDDVATGSMTLSTSYGSHNINVEEYKRPKFEIFLDSLAGNYKLGDDIKLVGRAISFSGANISGANVKYKVTRYRPYRTYYQFPENRDGVLIKTDTVIINESGEFVIDFKAIGETQYGTWNYLVEIDVTDISGETQSAEKHILLSDNQFSFAINFSEIYDVRTSKTDMEFDIRNFENKKQLRRVEVEVFELIEPNSLLRNRMWSMPSDFLYTEQEWNNVFPGNEYNIRNDINNLELGEKVYFQNIDMSKNERLDMSFLKNIASKRYCVKATIKDDYGKVVNAEKRFLSIDSDYKKFDISEILFVELLNNTVEPGSDARFFIASKSKINVLFLMQHKNKLYSEYIEINNEQKVFTIPVKEEHIGGFDVVFTIVKDNRNYNKSISVNVPYPSNKLDIKFHTFRDKLRPGEKEDLEISIKDSKGNVGNAELLVTLYDASLDKFVSNNWFFAPRKYSRNWFSVSTNSFNMKSDYGYVPNNIIKEYTPPILYYDFNWFGYQQYGRRMMKSGGKSFMAIDEANESEIFFSISEEMPITRVETSKEYEDAQDEVLNNIEIDYVALRTDFSETAFFYPHLATNEKGEMNLKFTMPHTLTKWKMMGLAHSKDMEYASFTKEIVTQKELMVSPNLPRFMRQDDAIELKAQIFNLTNNEINGTAKLQIFDATNMQILNIIDTSNIEQEFEITPNSNTLVSWWIQVPDSVNIIALRFSATSGAFSDAEQAIVPVLSNRIFVTEALPLPINAGETKQFVFKKLRNSQTNSSIKHHALSFEFTPHPVWYAIKALPYVNDNTYKSADSYANRLYVNTLALHIANSNPRINEIFDSWILDSTSSLISNLGKNPELKNILLQETPWLLDAKNEAQCMKRIVILFDKKRISTENKEVIAKLMKLQTVNGAWTWFENMPESVHITQHIATQLAYLKQKGLFEANELNDINRILEKAMMFFDNQLLKEYELLMIEQEKNKNLMPQITSSQVSRLYCRSILMDEMPLEKKYKKAFDYYIDIAKKEAFTQSIHTKAIMALLFHNVAEADIVNDLLKSIKENSLCSEEMGMYWKDNIAGYMWHQFPIETQSLLIELFHDVAQDKEAVAQMKQWLLKQKQTNTWNTPRASVVAISALLVGNDNLLAQSEPITAQVGNIKIDEEYLQTLDVEAGSGYFKTKWEGENIEPSMANITITNPNNSAAYGAMYWQYFDKIDNISESKTNISVSKKLFVERQTAKGRIIELITPKVKLKVGDRVIVRIELRTDRTMEYVHLKDLRAACFEPENVLSSYKYQDGLGYYESTRDVSTDFFFSYINKGVYVFEYPLVVSQKGEFYSGIASFQCMYAPEFISNSEGIKVVVE